MIKLVHTMKISMNVQHLRRLGTLPTSGEGVGINGKAEAGEGEEGKRG